MKPVLLRSKLLNVIYLLVLAFYICTAKEFLSEECATNSLPLHNVKIEIMEDEPPDWKQEEVDFSGYSVPPVLKVMTVKLKRNTVYCYSGGPGDGNTGCNYKSEPVPLEEGELSQWFSRQQCLIGKVCLNEGDCWGSGAQACLEENPVRDKWTNPKFLNGDAQPFTVFAYHTCTMSYDCKINVDYNQAMLTGTEGKLKVQIETPLTNEIIEIEKNKNMYKGEKDFYYYVEDFEIREIKGRMRCFSLEKEVKNCLIIDGPKKGEVITPSNDCTAHKDNIFISFECSKEPENHGNKWIQLVNRNPQDSASIRDVEESIRLIYYNSERTSFNVARLLLQINSIKRTIGRMIKASSSRDEMYLGLLLERQVMAVSERGGGFKISRCRVPNNRLKVCTTHFKYEKGVWKSKAPEDDCIDVFENTTNSSPLKIQLFPSAEVEFEEASLERVFGSIKDKSEALRYESLPGYHFNTVERKGITSEFNSDTESNWFTNYLYNHILLLLVIISLILSIINCLKR